MTSGNRLDGEGRWKQLADELEAFENRLHSQEEEVPQSAEALPGLNGAKEALRLIEQMGVLESLKAGKTPVSTENAETCDISATAPEDSETPGNLNIRLGEYVLREVLGRGGHGIVYLADDPMLKRQVALKVPRPEMLLNDEMRQRFLSEARMASRLEHPHLVQVYEAGEIGSICFMVSAYCPGPTLSAWLKALPQPMPTRVAAELVGLLADTVAFIHSRGVLHRDLKPGNVLLQNGPAPGQPAESLKDLGTPRICDFGLAKSLEESDLMTASRALLGTPAYMSPEQAEGRREAIGTATDIWALGAILYECLTGKPPFGQGDQARLLLAVLHEEPSSIRRARPEVSRDLETICLKCLEKNPQRRYVSAAELSSDLRRWWKGLPIQARRHTLVERLVLWARREPFFALASAIALGLVLLLVGGGIWFLIHRAETLAQVTLEAERRREAEDRAQSRLFLNGVISINAREARRKPGWTWENLRDIAALAPLASTLEAQTQLRSEAVAALSSPDIRLGKKIVPGFKAYQLAYHPKGDWLALAQGVSDDDENKPMEVLLVDPQSGDIRRRLLFSSNTEWIRKNERAESSTAMAVSPDGRHLAVGTRSGWIHLWDLKEKEPRALSWQGSASAVIDQLAFGPDGGSVYSLDRAGKGLRWKVGVRETALPIFGIAKIEYIVPNSPPGTLYLQSMDRLVCYTRDNPEIPQVGDYSLEASSQIPRSSNNIWFRAVAPGRAVGVQEFYNGLWLFDISTGMKTQQLQESEGGRANTTVLFSPDGRVIARNSPNGLQIWETASGQLVARLTIPLGLFALTFHPDGKRVAVNTNDGVYLCDIGGSMEHSTLTPLSLQFHLKSMGFTDSGNALMSLHEQLGPERLGALGHQFELRSLDVDADSPPINPVKNGILGQVGSFMSLVAQPGDGLLAMFPNAIVSWPRKTRNEYTISKTLKEKECRSLVTDVRGEAWLANAYELWHNPHPSEESGWTSFWRSDPNIFGAGMDFTRMVVGPRWAVVGRRDGVCLVFDSQTRKHLHTWNACDSRVESLAMDAGGERLLVGSARGMVSVYSLPEGQRLQALPSHDDKVTGVAFLRDIFLVSASFDKELRFFSANGTLLFTWHTRGGIEDFQLSPDQANLAIYVDKENSIRLWRLDWLIQRLQDLGLPLPLSPGIPRPLRQQAEKEDRDVLRAPRPSSPHGMKVQWYQGLRFDHPLRESFVSKLDDIWGFAVDLSTYSVCYSGWVEPPGPGKYRLLLESNAHLYRLRVDGALAGEANGNTPTIQSDKEYESTGKPWFIQVEGYGPASPGYCRLLWQTEGQKEPTVVPESAYYHDYRATRWHQQGKKW